MKKIVIIVSCIFSFIKMYAQISTNEQPISFTRSIETNIVQRIDVKTMPELDMEAITKEDLEDEEYDYPPRFGYSHLVEFNLQNSGIWQELPNGDKIWHLTISCPKALSINLLYDKFWIPEGGKYFIYTSDKKQYLGAFTNKNNKGDKSNIQGFATGLLYGDEITLEYYQPKDVSSEAIISISNVVHGYRYITSSVKSLGESGSCNVNVNCSEGDNWQNEKRAVAMILVNGNRYCSGSLIRSTSNTFQPLFLTADHCLGGRANYEYAGVPGFKYDAISSPTLNHWSFMWNYEAPGCSNISYEPAHITTVGATILANNSYSDFALLELSEDPLTLSNYTPYYLGWDRSGYSGTGGAGIHHPSGDVKKISTYSMTPVPTQYLDYLVSDNGTHWRVNWIQTSNGHGITEGGSSGSPLLNDNHKVIGQLHGGDSKCSNLSGSDWYGKFDVSWTGNGNSDNRRRLDHWLNPNGVYTTLNGTYPFSIEGKNIVCSSASYYVRNLQSNLTVTWSFQNSTSLNSLITSNSPATNQCTINNPSHLTINDTLVASIYRSGQLVTTVKKHVKAYNTLSGTYTQVPENHNKYGYSTFAGTLGEDGEIFVNPACDITINSQNFQYMTVTSSNSSIALNVQPTSVGFYVPFNSGISHFSINASSTGGCNDFSFIVHIMTMPLHSLDVSYLENEIQLTLSSEGEDMLSSAQTLTKNADQPVWNIEIVNALTGKVVCSGQQTNPQLNVDTTGWDPGVYIIRVTIGEEVITKKISIK